MFKFDEVLELIRLVAEKRIASVEIENDDGSRLRVDGVAETPVVQATPQVPMHGVAVAAEPQTAPATSATGETADEGDDDLHKVTSPIVGTFYRSPSPDAEAFAKPGDRVEKGQVICIVEAMKLFNEIESDAAGIVEKVLVENEEPVEFGQPLFAIRLD